MEQDIDQVILTAAAIAARNRELAADLAADYAGRKLTVVVLSNGALFFAADLLRLIPLPLQLDSIGVASYIGEKSEAVELRSDLKTDVQGRHVLVIDDIFDTGRTLQAVSQHLRKSKPASIRTCVLLQKEVARETSVQPDYRGFAIENVFVVGYGLDYNEHYRNLPYIGVLKPEAKRTGPRRKQ